MKRLSIALLLSISMSAASSPADVGQGRLPPEYQWGRCLLRIDSKTYISGRCAYYIGRGGSFEIHGPRQIWAGIDYPKPMIFADEQSNDYFAQVDVEGGQAEGFWNWDPRATHAHSYLGTLVRKGACWVGATARVCLWKQ